MGGSAVILASRPSGTAAVETDVRWLHNFDANANTLEVRTTPVASGTTGGDTIMGFQYDYFASSSAAPATPHPGPASASSMVVFGAALAALTTRMTAAEAAAATEKTRMDTAAAGLTTNTLAIAGHTTAIAANASAVAAIPKYQVISSYEFGANVDALNRALMAGASGNTADVTLGNAGARTIWGVPYKGVIKQISYSAQLGNPADSVLTVRLNKSSSSETDIALTNLVANEARLLTISIAVNAGDEVQVYQKSGTLLGQFVCCFQEVIQESDIP